MPDKNLDIGSLFVALLVAQNHLTEDIEAWYASGKMTLKVKEEAKKKPVFCRNDVGGLVMCNTMTKKFKTDFLILAMQAYSATSFGILDTLSMPSKKLLKKQIFKVRINTNSFYDTHRTNSVKYSCRHYFVLSTTLFHTKSTNAGG